MIMESESERERERKIKDIIDGSVRKIKRFIDWPDSDISKLKEEIEALLFNRIFSLGYYPISVGLQIVEEIDYGEIEITLFNPNSHKSLDDPRKQFTFNFMIEREYFNYFFGLLVKMGITDNMLNEKIFNNQKSKNRGSIVSTKIIWEVDVIDGDSVGCEITTISNTNSKRKFIDIEAANIENIIDDYLKVIKWNKIVKKKKLFVPEKSQLIIKREYRDNELISESVSDDFDTNDIKEINLFEKSPDKNGKIKFFFEIV